MRAVAPEALFLELRDTQRSWIDYRDAFSAEVALANRGWVSDDTPAESWPEFWVARTATTEARTEYLLGWLHQLEGAFAALGPWEGEWVDSFGGHLFIAQLNEEQLQFRLEVVRGPTAHSGLIAGIADISGDTARFTTWIPDLQQKAGIVLKLTGPTVNVQTNGAIQWFHGARAYFSGTYVRVDHLSREATLSLANAVASASRYAAVPTKHAPLPPSGLNRKRR